jgi:HD-like signal output (HDOD) protein/ActR/RegA family two-component response regulator
MTQRILFVDDELMVLKGLERSLHGMRGEWEMQFVLGGPEALQVMAREPFDVVITDMRMPGMDGAQLLDQVRQRFSQTVRMVLSGQSDKNAVFRAVRPTHQYLSKPCNVEELKQKLKCALSLRDVLDSPELKRRVSQMENVPSLPSLYRELRLQLESSHPDLNEITDIISRDPGMTAKLLQLVSSDFLVSTSCFSSPKQAVSIIGIDNLRSLVLSGGLFCELPEALAEKLAPAWRHFYTTARFAETIAECEHSADSVVQNCFAAGLLHEIGWIVLATAYADQIDSFAPNSSTLLPAGIGERGAFGSTHGLAGAYLLGLWGLPDAIVEAVAGHHAPSQVCPTGFCPLLAVHAATFWDWQWHGPLGFDGEDPAMDDACFAAVGLQERLAVWQQRCREVNEALKDKN